MLTKFYIHQLVLLLVQLIFKKDNVNTRKSLTCAIVLQCFQFISPVSNYTLAVGPLCSYCLWTAYFTSRTYKDCFPTICWFCDLKLRLISPISMITLKELSLFRKFLNHSYYSNPCGLEPTFTTNVAIIAYRHHTGLWAKKVKINNYN